MISPRRGLGRARRACPIDDRDSLILRERATAITLSLPFNAIQM